MVKEKVAQNEQLEKEIAKMLARVNETKIEISVVRPVWEELI